MCKFNYRDRPIRTALVCAIAVTLAISHITAGEPPQLQVNLVARKVVVSDKGETLVPAETAKPGDIIEYEATYKNRGPSSLSNIAATVPVPAGLVLIEETAKPVAQQASVDGKNFAPAPLIRDVMTPSGVMQRQPVPLGEYRALRWTMSEVAAGTEVKVALRARVLTNNNSK